MKNNNVTAWLAVPVVLCALSATFAQDAEEEAVTYTPVEAYTCDYLDGKGPADLDAVIATWNAWMDEHGVDYYFAVTMTPWYYGPETFDVGWIGAWTDGAKMGEDTDRWLADGGEIGAEFFEVVECDTHSNFASTNIKPPPDGPPPDNLVLYFSDCNFTEGGDFDAAIAGMQAWADYRTEAGYEGGEWIWYPAFGSGDMEFDFKTVSSFANHTAAGKAYDMYGTGGDWQKDMELNAANFSCDISRVYNGRVVRRTPAPDAE